MSGRGVQRPAVADIEGIDMVLARQPGRKRVQGIGPSAQQAKRMAGGGITDGPGLGSRR